MELESKIREAYKYYKDLYSDAVILFRVGNDYMMYFSDAMYAARVLNKTTANLEGVGDPIPMLSIHTDQYLDVMEKLSSSKFTVRAVDYRNDNGEFDIPDVGKLKSESDMDY